MWLEIVKSLQRESVQLEFCEEQVRQKVGERICSRAWEIEFKLGILVTKKDQGEKWEHLPPVAVMSKVERQEQTGV